MYKTSMRFDPEKHHRKTIRKQGYDYARPGMYFVTVCTHKRACLFGHVAQKEMVLNDAGGMVQDVWNALPARFTHTKLDEIIVMPDHIHGIINIVQPRKGESCIRPPRDHRPPDREMGDHKDRPNGDRPNGDRPNKDRPDGTLPGSLGRIIQAFTSITTHEYIIGVRRYGWRPFYRKLWQRNYYEHIIRNELELNQIRAYIRSNPAKWNTDLIPWQ